MALPSDGERAVLNRVRPGEGRRLREDRRTREAVIRPMRNGTPGRALPVEPEPWRQAAQLHIH